MRVLSRICFLSMALLAASTAEANQNVVVVLDDSGSMGERLSTERPIVHGASQMATESEQIADHRVYSQEALSLPRRFEAPHPPLPLSGQLVGNLGPIVRVLRCHVRHRRRRRATRGRIAPDLV